MTCRIDGEWRVVHSGTDGRTWTGRTTRGTGSADQRSVRRTPGYPVDAAPTAISFLSHVSDEEPMEARPGVEPGCAALQAAA